MVHFKETALMPTVIALSDQALTATIKDEENNKTYFIKEDVDVFASILKDLDLCEDFANGEVDFLDAGGELKTWSFSDFWDSLEDSDQRECLITLFLEMMAMQFPKEPIAVIEFLHLNSIQQQNFVDYSISAVGMKYRWIWEFSQFAKGMSNYWNPAWGAKMAKVARLFYKCVPQEKREQYLFERIERNTLAYQSKAA